MRLFTPRRLALCLLAVPFVLGLPGCGSGPRVVPVRGLVTYKGEPLKSGAVIFSPVDPAGRSATAKIGTDGRFVPTTLNPEDGLVAGDYKVSVTSYSVNVAELPPIEAAKLKDGGLAIPKKYTDFSTSGLTVNVTPADSGKEYKLELAD